MKFLNQSTIKMRLSESSCLMQHLSNTENQSEWSLTATLELQSFVQLCNGNVYQFKIFLHFTVTVPIICHEKSGTLNWNCWESIVTRRFDGFHKEENSGRMPCNALFVTVFFLFRNILRRRQAVKIHLSFLLLIYHSVPLPCAIIYYFMMERQHKQHYSNLTTYQLEKSWKTSYKT